MLNSRLYGIASRNSKYVCLNCLHRKLRLPTSQGRHNVSTATALAQNDSDGSTNSVEEKRDKDETAKPNDNKEGNTQKGEGSLGRQANFKHDQTDTPKPMPQAVVEARPDPLGVSSSPSEGVRSKERRHRSKRERLRRNTEISAGESVTDGKDSQEPSEAGHRESPNHNSDSGKEIQSGNVGDSTKDPKHRKAKKSSPNSKDTEQGEQRAHALHTPSDSKPTAPKKKGRYRKRADRLSRRQTSRTAPAPHPPNPELIKWVIGKKAGQANVGGTIEELSAKSLNIQRKLASILSIDEVNI